MAAQIVVRKGNRQYRIDKDELKRYENDGYKVASGKGTELASPKKPTPSTPPDVPPEVKTGTGTGGTPPPPGASGSGTAPAGSKPAGTG